MRTYIILASLFLSVAISAQTKFVKHEDNPVLKVGSPSSWESKQVSHPRIIYDGSIYRMWYAGSNDTCRQIGYATSADGIYWTKHPGNPVIKIGESGAPDGMVVSPGAVVYDGTLYHMYYTARSFVNAGTICHATSPDGILWTKDDANNPLLKPGQSGCWDDYGLSAGPVLKQGTNWKMWYTGFCADTRWHTGIATSSDGVHWIKDTLYNPLLHPGASGAWDEYEQWITDVLSDSSYYEAFYLGNLKQCALGYAVSRDGIAWGKYEGNPILTPEQLTDDKAFLFQSCVLRNGEEYKIWYSDGMTAQICFAVTTEILKDKNQLALLTPPNTVAGPDTVAPRPNDQVSKEINPFTVSFDGQNVNFKNFITANGTKVMEFDVSIAMELTKIAGMSSVTNNDATIKRIGGGAFVILKNGIVAVFPKDNSNKSVIKSLATQENITGVYENQLVSAIVIVTNNALTLLNPKIELNIPLTELFDGRKMGSLAIIQDPDKPNCALVTGNGVPILRVFADATNIDQSVQYYSPTTLLGAR